MRDNYGNNVNTASNKAWHHNMGIDRCSFYTISCSEYEIYI